MKWKVFTSFMGVTSLLGWLVVIGGYQHPTTWEMLDAVAPTLFVVIAIFYAFNIEVLDMAVLKYLRIFAFLYYAKELFMMPWRTYTMIAAGRIPVGAIAFSVAVVVIIDLLLMLAVQRYSNGLTQRSHSTQAVLRA